MSHPLLEKQPDIVESLVRVLPTPEAAPYVADWPDDEIEFYRTGDEWHSFSERAEMLGRIRKVKAALDVLSVLGLAFHTEECIEPQPGEVWQDSEGTLYAFVGISPKYKNRKWMAFGCGDALYEDDMAEKDVPRKRVFDLEGKFVGTGPLDYPNGCAFREKKVD